MLYAPTLSHMNIMRKVFDDCAQGNYLDENIGMIRVACKKLGPFASQVGYEDRRGEKAEECLRKVSEIANALYRQHRCTKKQDKWLDSQGIAQLFLLPDHRALLQDVIRYTKNSNCSRSK